MTAKQHQEEKIKTISVEEEYKAGWCNNKSKGRQKPWAWNNRCDKCMSWVARNNRWSSIHARTVAVFGSLAAKKMQK
jgi:hypothetical protein